MTTETDVGTHVPLVYTCPKELTVRRETLRVGNQHLNPKGAHGEGLKKLLNEEGYSCIIGQFAIAAGVPIRCLFDNDGPRALVNNEEIRFEPFVYDDVLSNEIISINDAPDITLAEKEAATIARMAEYGYEVTYAGRYGSKTRTGLLTKARDRLVGLINNAFGIS